MRKNALIIAVALVCLAAFAAGGCAKKRTESMPPGASKVQIKDDSQFNDAQPPVQPIIDEQPKIDEQAIAAEKRAKAIDTMSYMVTFAFDSYDLSDEARQTLSEKAEVMKEYPELRLVIEGYCDERGTEEYNLALGERRARAAFEHLVILGIAPERMSIVSFGEERPLDPGHTESAWAKNRRDEFKLSY